MSTRTKADKNRKILFIVSSTAQAEMFAHVCKCLTEWDIKAINTDKLKNQSEIEKVLRDLNFAFNTIKYMNLSHIKAILVEEQPDIIVFGHDRNPLDRLFIKAANTKEIPTLLIQDGVLAANQDEKPRKRSASIKLKYWLNLPIRALLFFIGNNYSWKLKIEIALFELRYGNRGNKQIYGHGECTQMAVFGDIVKRMFISDGISSERIVVAGNPKFDAVIKARSDNCKEKVSQRFGIPMDKDIVLLITSYFVEEGIWTAEQRRDFVLAIANATAKLSDTRLVIKLHPPYENEDHYLEIIKELSPKPVVCKYANLPELINACNLVVTVSSTAALEAMAVEKPVLIINFDKDTGASFYRRSGALFAYKADDVLPMIKKSLHDPGTKEQMREATSKFVFDQAYIQDGLATQRISDLIRNMVFR